MTSDRGVPIPANVIMPSLGMDQETGLLVRWFKYEGEFVIKGESIMEIETDKVTVEIEAIATGILTNVTAQEGDDIPVGRVIAQIVEVDQIDSPAPHPTEDEAPSTAPTISTDESSLVGETVAESESTARLDHRTEEGQISPQVGIRVLASPLARRLANERGIDLETVEGTGPEGAILAADLPSAPPIAVGTAPMRDEPSVLESETAAPSAEPIPASRAWSLMAKRMTESWTTVPHFVLMREVEATALIEMRTRIGPAVEQRAGARPTFTDLLAKVAASALRAHPRLNASWDHGQLRTNPQVNMGIATAVQDALVVPVIRGADGLGVGEITLHRRDLVDRANSGRLTPSDLSDGTFTLTNLGMYGVDAFTAIVNPPQAAILAVGRIADRVVARDGQPAVRPTMILTLSCDHRVVDGARAAQFLDDVARLIEEPWGLLA